MAQTKSQKARKKASREAIQHIAGHGNYYTDTIKPFLVKNVPKGTFSKLGSAGGAGVGALTRIPGANLVGGAGGSYLGNALSRILGFGDYEVKENTISKIGKAVSAGELIPDFGMRGNATRIRHREFITDILVPANPTTFNNTGYAINAGNPILFPWLSTVAAQYQQYKFEGLVFEFKTLTSEVATGGPMGAVILATNYDVLEAEYPDKVHMENAQYSVSAKPSVSQFHTVECAPNETGQNLYYVRDSTSTLTASADARFSDLGKFQLATAGLPGSAFQVLGELWASYDVILYKPEIVNLFSVGTKIAPTGSVTKSLFYGTSPVVTGDTRVGVSGNTLTAVNTGDSLLVMTAAGTGVLAPNITTSTATASLLESCVNTTSTLAIFVYRISVTAPGQTFVTDFSSSTTIAGGSVRITTYNYALA